MWWKDKGDRSKIRKFLQEWEQKEELCHIDTPGPSADLLSVQLRILPAENPPSPSEEKEDYFNLLAVH